MDESTEFGFLRRSCDCRRCQACCEHIPGMLIPADLDRLIPTDADPFVWAESHLLASLREVWAGNVVILRASLVPRKQGNGHCHWLVEGRCQVHADAPYGCAFFDHGTDEEATERAAAGDKAVWEAFDDESLYDRLWHHLWGKGLRKTSGGEDRIALNDHLRATSLQRRGSGEKQASREKKKRERKARKRSRC